MKQLMYLGNLAVVASRNRGSVEAATLSSATAASVWATELFVCQAHLEATRVL